MNIRKLADCGIQVIDIHTDLSCTNTPESKLRVNMMNMMNEYESDKISEKTRLGMKTCAGEALHLGGIPPLGYDVHNGKYVINESEAAIVRLIFDMYLPGYTKRKMATKLNNRHLTTKVGAEFTTNSFACILSNRKYIGEYSWNRRAAKNQFNGKRNNSKLKAKSEIIVVPDAIPPIIDVDTFDKAQNLVNRSKTEARRGKSKRNYMLTSLDILYCKECGAPLIGICSKVHGKEYMRYRCPNHHKKKGRCALKDIRADFLDEAIAKAVIEYVLPKHALESFNKYTNKHRNMKSYQKAIAQCESNIDNLIRNLNSMYSEPLTKALNEKYEELKTLKAKQAMLDEQIELSDAEYKKVKQYLLKRLTTKRDLVEKEFLQRVIESVTVDNNNIELTLAQC